jgi:hypothetical protein
MRKRDKLRHLLGLPKKNKPLPESLQQIVIDYIDESVLIPNEEKRSRSYTRRALLTECMIFGTPMLGTAFAAIVADGGFRNNGLSVRHRAFCAGVALASFPLSVGVLGAGIPVAATTAAALAPIDILRKGRRAVLNNLAERPDYAMARFFLDIDKPKKTHQKIEAVLDSEGDNDEKLNEPSKRRNSL